MATVSGVWLTYRSVELSWSVSGWLQSVVFG